jgi:hypothetical protein
MQSGTTGINHSPCNRAERVWVAHALCIPIDGSPMPLSDALPHSILVSDHVPIQLDSYEAHLHTAPTPHRHRLNAVRVGRMNKHNRRRQHDNSFPWMVG